MQCSTPTPLSMVETHSSATGVTDWLCSHWVREWTGNRTQSRHWIGLSFRNICSALQKCSIPLLPWESNKASRGHALKTRTPKLRCPLIPLSEQRLPLKKGNVLKKFVFLHKFHFRFCIQFSLTSKTFSRWYRLI